MKKSFVTIILLFAFVQSYPQAEGKFRFGLDLGYAIPAGGGAGISFSIEPKYNIKDNMNVGLRIGVAGNTRDLLSFSNSSNRKASATTSYVATYDYYFNNGGGSLVPYLGGGLGYFNFATIEIFSSSDTGADVGGKFGGLIRGGIEWNKLRVGVEYNIVPKSELQTFNGESAGTSPNSYVGITVGFFIGGGKWGN